ncbi:MAG TPA: helix-turn-helix transcriptional regulator [Candidatus Binataceae bacterium]|jgi:transcriptional regulator with XRE-family HTH domain|nr:helix-turn-helix transcriptional regulator [Candidatus Binataceae bacterium]
MKKKTLGPVIKRQREALGLTQRELALKFGVKPSHVAYLENDRRRPSLMLLSRIADVLGLEKEGLFLLAHPEARSLINNRRPAPAPRLDRDQVWRDFARDKALLARHQVKPRELKVLSQVNLLGRVTAPRNFLFILNAIRQAVEEEEE